MEKGYIYILTNPGLKDNLVKIGFATNVESRVKQLSRKTAVPAPYEIYATYQVVNKRFLEDAKDKKNQDKYLHELIDSLNPDLRFRANREFYVMYPEEALNLLKVIAEISGTTNKIKVYKRTSEAAKEIKEKAAPFHFSMCGIKPGAEIVYVRDSSIKATVYDDTKVKYQNDIYSLTGLAKELMGGKEVAGHVAGPKYFAYKGKTLSVIRKEKEAKNK